MLRIYKYGLLPVIAPQALKLRREAIRLPEAEGPRSGVEACGSGQSLRVLFVGDSSAAGVGVTHQRDALALPTARQLASKLKATVHWQLIAKSGMNVEQALQHLKNATAGNADVLVGVLGTNDVTSQQAPQRFLNNYKSLVQYARAQLGIHGAVITGLPPLRILPAAPQPLRWYLGQYANRLDQKLKRWCGDSSVLSHLSMDWAAEPEKMAIDGYHPGITQYERWSELIGDQIISLMPNIRETCTNFGA